MVGRGGNLTGSQENVSVPEAARLFYRTELPRNSLEEAVARSFPSEKD